MQELFFYEICVNHNSILYISNKGHIISGLVAAAFASLNNIEAVDEKRKPSPKSVKHTRAQQIDAQILKAGDLNSLLLVAESPVVSRRHALKVNKYLEFICSE